MDNAHFQAIFASKLVLISNGIFAIFVLWNEQWWDLETWSRLVWRPFLRVSVSVSKVSGLETEYCKEMF